jgi:ParB-like chromosome segregation protein Spo0J
MENLLRAITEHLNKLDGEELITAINTLRRRIHEHSPFRNEPVDYVEWVPAAQVHANDYNPNTVAPPEMRLLELSILADGYTQPIVTHPEDQQLTVVDGFHRNRVGKESTSVRERVYGHLPIVRIRDDRTERGDRIAATVRHNRARGKHTITGMMKLVADLTKRNWNETKIAKELGMDADEVLRLKQITGLAALFQGEEFSEAWTVNPQTR